MTTDTFQQNDLNSSPGNEERTTTSEMAESLTGQPVEREPEDQAEGSAAQETGHEEAPTVADDPEMHDMDAQIASLKEYVPDIFKEAHKILGVPKTLEEKQTFINKCNELTDMEASDQ